MNTMFSWIQRLLPKHRFWLNVTVLAGGTALAQGLTILMSPLITRLYSPADLGVLAVFSSLLAHLMAIASLRYEFAISLPKEDRDAANLLVLCFLILLGMCIVTGLVVLLAGDKVIEWLNVSVLESYLWLLPIGLFGAGAYQILNYWAIRHRSFTSIARTKFAQSLAMNGTQVGFGFLNFGPIGLLLGHVAGQMSGTGTLLSLVWYKDRIAMKEISLSGVLACARRYRRFPIFSALSSLLNTAGLQVPVILLAAFYGLQVAGWFMLGQRVIGMPMMLIGSAVSQVYVGEISQLIREKPDAVYSFFLSTVKKLFLIGVLLLTAVGILAPFVFDIVFGSQWHQAAIFVQLMVPQFLLQFVVSPVSQSANLIERQDLQLIGDVCRLILGVGAIVLSYILEWPALAAVGVYSAAMVLTYLVFYRIYGKVIRTACRSISVMKHAGV